MISTIITIGLLITAIYNICKINKKNEALIRQLQLINDELKHFHEIGQKANEAEQNTIRALHEICNALNQYFKSTGEFMDQSTYTLATIAVCMVPFIDEIKEQAVRNEEYEKAQECDKIIKNIQDIVDRSNS